jgi:hypothetical protein
MKRNVQLLITGLVIAVLAANLASCTSYRGIASKPDGHNHYRPDFASLKLIKHHHNNDNKAVATNVATAANTTQPPAATAHVAPATKPAPKFVALLTGDAPMEKRIPNYVVDGMDDAKMEKVNAYLGKYSNNKVSVTKTASGKYFLKADSRKDFVKLTKVLYNQRKAAAPISEETQDILALVAGICGIVAIALCLIPYVDFISIPAGIAGIVLGALSLHSGRRHKWALLGIILGAIAVFLAIALIIVYSYVLFHLI